MVGVKYRIEKNAKRAQFEADQRLRANKVRSEVARTRREIKALTASIGQKALELVAAGETLNAPLQEIVDAILSLRSEIERKEAQIAAIMAEPWVAPPPPPPPPPRPPKPVTPAGEVRKVEPKPTAPSRDQVLNRLQFYIEAEGSISQCPNCRSITEPGAAVCRHCGFRLTT
jgi:hypothetical protein